MPRSDRHGDRPTPAALLYDAARRAAVRAALGYLDDALDRAREEDVRCRSLSEAVRFLRRHARDDAPFDAFEAALDLAEPRRRWQNANAALNGIRHALGRLAEG